MKIRNFCQVLVSISVDLLDSFGIVSWSNYYILNSYQHQDWFISPGTIERTYIWISFLSRNFATRLGQKKNILLLSDMWIFKLVCFLLKISHTQYILPNSSSNVPQNSRQKTGLVGRQAQYVLTHCTYPDIGPFNRCWWNE